MTGVWKPTATVAAAIERDGRSLFVEEIFDGPPVLNQLAGRRFPLAVLSSEFA